MWKVPYINLPEQYKSLKGELLYKIDSIMEEGRFVGGEEVTKFEESICKYLDVKYTVGLNSGTDALFLALKALDIGEGDEVITVSHTFVSTIASIIHTGAKPILVDVRWDFNIDWSVIEKAITGKTRAIIPVHLNGRPCIMTRITEIAETYHIRIIEDACQALGASTNNRKVGTFGIGCFSLHPLKVLSVCGDGGFLTTNDRITYERVRLLRDHCQETKDSIIGFGYNSRLDNLQAGIANVKLQYLDMWISRRRSIARRYHEGLKDLNALAIVLPPPPFIDPDGYFCDIYSSYVIRVLNNKRDLLKQFLTSVGIETMVNWYTPNHLQPKLGLSEWKLPITEKISGEVLSLPISAEITNEEVDYVISKIKEFFNE